MLYDFVGNPDNDELSVEAGAIVQIVIKDESGWWRAQDALGKEGFVPHNYLETV
jgi:hypothetical protein